MTVRQLLKSMTSHELAEWQVFFKMEQDRTMGKPKKINAKAAMTAMFGHLIKKRVD